MAAGRNLISITGLLIVSAILIALVFASCADLNAKRTATTPPATTPPAAPPTATASPPDADAVPPPDGHELVTIAGETFRLELSNDNITRQAGLMHRTSIPDDGGMIFVFPDARMRSFWMAYCLIDMDLMFLDPRGRVTAAHRMTAKPPRRPDEARFAYEQRMRMDDYTSRYPAQFAIELKAGSLDRLGIGVEDLIELDLARLKAEAR